MKISIQAFIYHKAAEHYSDCFDRFGFNTETNKFAISDGVSKSFFPDIWAQLLVNFYINDIATSNIEDITSYTMIQHRWEQIVSEIVNRPNQKYFVRNFFHQGRSAAATFVGLHFYVEKGKIKWEAIALGDSFLFFVPKQIENLNDDFKKIFCLSSKKDFEFNNFPDFFDSRSRRKGNVKHRTGQLTEGTFYLMTDALSQWFVAEKQTALDEINTWEDQEKFESRINELRKSNLVNDDSTILILNVSEDGLNSINYEYKYITDLDSLINEEKSQIERTTFIKEELPTIDISKPQEDTGEVSPIEEESKTGNAADLQTTTNTEEDLIQDSNVNTPIREEQINTTERKNNFWERRFEEFQRSVYLFQQYWNNFDILSDYGHPGMIDYEEETEERNFVNNKSEPKASEEKSPKNEGEHEGEIKEGEKRKISDNKEGDVNSIIDKF